MGWSPFANSRFQMGVTVMGFAEDFGQYALRDFYLESFQDKFSRLLKNFCLLKVDSNASGLVAHWGPPPRKFKGTS